jgi:hypothetical protein
VVHQILPYSFTSPRIAALTIARFARASRHTITHRCGRRPAATPGLYFGVKILA